MMTGCAAAYRATVISVEIVCFFPIFASKMETNSSSDTSTCVNVQLDFMGFENLYALKPYKGPY